MPDARAHWDEIYGAKAPEQFSWTQASPEPSLSMIRALQLDKRDPIIDIGAGVSVLVDALLDEGHERIGALDVSLEALKGLSARLGPERAARVELIVGDIRHWRPRPRAYALWHDRAALHFLTEEADQRRYASAAATGVRPGGHAVIGAFALDGGPTRCSGLAVQRHDEASIKALFGAEFELLEHRIETHATPWGAEQRFAWFVLRRKPE